MREPSMSRKQLLHLARNQRIPDRNQRIVLLYELGMSQTKIAALYGVSRQRVFQIVGQVYRRRRLIDALGGVNPRRSDYESSRWPGNCRGCIGRPNLQVGHA